MNIVDSVLRDIHTHLALAAPERGGALYGPRGHTLITHFEYDDQAHVSPVSYLPSARLIENVGRIERETGYEFKGIIHSHPHGYTRPSVGDERTIASFFRLNPHVAAIALPIVQRPSVTQDTTHADFIHWYRAERRAPFIPGQSCMHETRMYSDVALAIIEEELHVIPVQRHMQLLLNTLEQHGMPMSCVAGLQQIQVGGAMLTGLTARGPAGHELMFFVGLDYPLLPPLVLYQKEAVTQNLSVQWDALHGEAEVWLDRIALALLRQWRKTCKACATCQRRAG